MRAFLLNAPKISLNSLVWQVGKAPRTAMNIVAELFVVTFKIMWSFVLAGAKWFVRPREKSVGGQVCVVTGAGSGLGRLFALEFARRRATLVLWDINTQGNEETAEMVREIYRKLSPSEGKLRLNVFFSIAVFFLTCMF